jgi:exoribonuclease R
MILNSSVDLHVCTIRIYFLLYSDIIREVGVSGELKSESMAILLENDIDISPYDMQLCQYFPHAEFQIPEKELRSRADLR